MQKLSKKYSNITFIKLFILIGLFTVSHISYAASINFSPSSGSYKVGDTIKVKILINSQGVPINATEDNIKFSSDTLQLVSISKAGSIITNWIVDPAFSNSAGTASLIGGILGGNGYTGSGGLVATLTFKAHSVGAANVSFISASILANDGNGTEVASSRGNASFDISPAVVQKVQVPEEKATSSSSNDSTIKIQQIKDSVSNNSSTRFLILAPRPVKDNTYTIQVDPLEIISWVDDGTHIFEIPPISKGDHNINVRAFDNNGNIMSGFLKFNSSIVMKPVITTYPSQLHPGDIIVLKGLAEPDSDIVLNILNTETEQLTVSHTNTNSNGKFSFVSDIKVTLGSYTIIAKTVTESGAESAESVPVTFKVVLGTWGRFMEIISSSIIISWLLLICLLISMYFVYKTHKSRKKLREKINETKDTITKSFGILADDVTTGAHVSMSEIKKDLKDAEKLLIKEVKDLDKEI